jgi:hypothetical protein
VGRALSKPNNQAYQQEKIEARKSGCFVMQKMQGLANHQYSTSRGWPFQRPSRGANSLKVRCNAQETDSTNRPVRKKDAGETAEQQDLQHSLLLLITRVYFSAA